MAPHFSMHSPCKSGEIIDRRNRASATVGIRFNLILLACLFGMLSQGGLVAQAADSNQARASLHALALKTEHLVEPLGIESQHPRFRWLLESEERGQLQSAYQVLVASSLENLAKGKGDKWDSGRVESDNSVEVSYAGHELVSGERAYWKVRVWDQQGRAGAYSTPTFFEMGLLKPGDWQGRWIWAAKNPQAPLLRRSVTFASPVRRARIYVSGLGYYELSINGRKVGDRVLEPAPTQYNNDSSVKISSRVMYAVYDVTDALQAGENAIGVMLGNGWYSPQPNPSWQPDWAVPYGDRPRMILQMNVELADGRTISVASDASWKSAAGPVMDNSFVHGESYDARLEQPGWDKPGFDDASWQSAAFAEAPSGVLTAELMPPERVMQTLPAVKAFNSKEPETFENTVTYDFGQLLSGWARLTVSGKPGAKVTMIFGSRLYPEDDTLDTRSNSPFNGVSRQIDTYVLKGEGTEVWEPRFTLHGFRYVEVRTSGPGEDLFMPGATQIVKNIEARFVHSALEPNGSFTSSNELLNKIHHNIQWTFMSSFQGMLQDAADRAERVSYLGDPSFVAEDYIYNYDMLAFWEKWLKDIQGDQTESGWIPIRSPYRRTRGEEPNETVFPSWQSTYVLLPWLMYQYYGDNQVLADHYSNLKRFVDYLSAASRNYLIPPGSLLGDHMEPQDNGFSNFSPLRTPAELTDNAHYYQDVDLLSRMAEVLGRTDDANRYRNLACKIAEAFNRHFLNPTTSQYATGSQTANAVALHVGLVPGERVKAVMKNLVDDIVKRDYHVSTGIIGSDAVVQTLPQHGAADVMYRLANQTTYPSLGHQVMMGATAVCESYEGGPWLSQNMKMFGSMDKYFYRNLAGIAPASPGYRRALIRPQSVGELRHVAATQKTVRGEISVEWTRKDNTFDLKVSIPAGMAADIAVPNLGLRDLGITEGVAPVWRSGAYVPGVPGLTGARAEGEAIVFQAGSGDYHFTLHDAAP